MFANCLPINGCSAIAIRDPQEREPEVLADCSGPGCRNQVYDGDEDALYDIETGEWFCDRRCYVARKIQQGSVIWCCERGM